MISIICGNETCGRQPVNRRNLPLSPRSKTGFFFNRFASVTAHSRQSTPAFSARNLQKFPDHVRFAGGYDEILRRRVAENPRHGLGVIAGVTPIHDGVQIAQHQFFGLVLLERQHPANDFLGQKLGRAKMRFVIVKDAGGGEHAEFTPEMAAAMDAHRFRDAIDVFRIQRRGFILRLDDRRTKNMRRSSVEQPRVP